MATKTNPVTFFDAVVECVTKDLKNGHGNNIKGIIANEEGFRDLSDGKKVSQIQFGLIEVNFIILEINNKEYQVFSLHDRHPLICSLINFLYPTPKKKSNALDRKVKICCCIDENNSLLLK